MTKYKHLLLIILAFIAGSFISIATTVALAHGGDVSKIHACVRNTAVGNLSNIRIVSATTNCNANETALDWNIQGVPGPTGAPGPTGVPGQAASGSANFGLPFICDSYGKVTDLSPFADKFKNKDFSNTIIHGCIFSNADISGVIFKNGDLRQSHFDDSNLSNADLSNANLSHAGYGYGGFGSTFVNTNLQNTNLQNANLSQVNFTGAQNMDTANITGATWANTTCPDGTNSDDNSNTCTGHLTP